MQLPLVAAASGQDGSGGLYQPPDATRQVPPHEAQRNAHARPAKVFSLKHVGADRRLRSRSKCWHSPTPDAPGSAKALMRGRFSVLADATTRIPQAGARGKNADPPFDRRAASAVKTGQGSTVSRSQARRILRPASRSFSVAIANVIRKCGDRPKAAPGTAATPAFSTR